MRCRRHVERFVSLWCIAATACGCSVTRPRAPEPEPMAQAMPEKPRASRPKFSPDQTGKLAMAAAAELEKNGDADGAIAQYEKARQLDPRLTQVAHALAVLYDRQGDFSRASAEYKKALVATPNDPALLNDMGYFCYERGQWDEAETWLRKAVKLNPRHERAWVNLGMALAQQGREAESLEAFAKVVTAAEARSNLGIILAQRGEQLKAKRWLAESLALEPDGKLPQAVLAELQKKDKKPQTGAVIRASNK